MKLDVAVGQTSAVMPIIHEGFNYNFFYNITTVVESVPIFVVMW